MVGRKTFGDTGVFSSQMCVLFEVSTFICFRDLVKCDYISLLLKAFSLAVFWYNFIILKTFHFPNVCHKIDCR